MAKMCLAGKRHGTAMRTQREFYSLAFASKASEFHSVLGGRDSCLREHGDDTEVQQGGWKTGFVWRVVGSWLEVVGTGHFRKTDSKADPSVQSLPMSLSSQSI